MTLQVYTSQYRCTDVDRLDITVKTGNKIFAPLWNMVKGHKDKSMSDEKYTELYAKIMRKSYRDNRDQWNELLSRDRVVLVCFCKGDGFCHRYLLKDMLVKLGAEYKGEI